MHVYYQSLSEKLFILTQYGLTSLVICKLLFYVKSSAFRNWRIHIKFKITTTLKATIIVCWDMMLRSLEQWHQHLWGTCHFHLQGRARFLQNAGTYLPKYKMFLTSEQTVIVTGLIQGKHDSLLNWWFYNFMVEREFKTYCSSIIQHTTKREKVVNPQEMHLKFLILIFHQKIA